MANGEATAQNDAVRTTHYPVLRIAPPSAVTVAALPVADGLLALALLAGEHPDAQTTETPARVLLRDRLSPVQQRAAHALFAPPVVAGFVAWEAALVAPDTDALRRTVDALPDAAIVAYVVRAAGNLAPDAPQSPGIWQSLTEDEEWAAAYLAHYLDPPPADPAPVQAILAQPRAVRRQLVDLLAASALLPDDSAWYAAALDRLHATDPVTLAAHVPTDLRGREAVVFPSRFLAAGSVCIALPTSNRVFIAVAFPAAATSETDPATPAPIIADAATYQEIHRLLADPARWAAVRLLLVAPRYGQELSEMLKLSVATVSHHLGLLKALDLVDTVREEHRLYYHLRTGRLRALLAGAEHGLFSDQP